MSEKKKHRVMIGSEISLLCMIIATLSTNAASSNPPSNGVSYNKNNQVTVQNALDDLYTKANYGNATASQILKGRTALVGGKQVTGTYVAPTCPTLASQTPGDAKPENIDKGKIAWVNGEKIEGSRQYLASKLKLGDYIQYTPKKSFYYISDADTGSVSSSSANTAQKITPSELTLWRVIKMNGDGTVDIVSENISSTKITVSASAGYNNYIGTLNKLASAYETDGITVGSRHMGYDSTKAREYVDFKENIDSNREDRYIYTYEDEGYKKDVFLVEQAVGSIKATIPGATIPGSSENENYYLASREKVHVSGVYNEFIDADLRGVRSYPDTVSRAECVYFGPNFRCANSVRPIVVLKSTLKITGGNGTEESPYTLDV